jgi:hypothetical protein
LHGPVVSSPSTSLSPLVRLRFALGYRPGFAPCFGPCFALGFRPGLARGLGPAFAFLPPFWALVILPRLFSALTALARLIVTSLPSFFSSEVQIEEPIRSTIEALTVLSSPP